MNGRGWWCEHLATSVNSWRLAIAQRQSGRRRSGRAEEESQGRAPRAGEQIQAGGMGLTRKSSVSQRANGQIAALRRRSRSA